MRRVVLAEFEPLSDEKRVELSRKVKSVESRRARCRLTCKGNMKEASKEIRRKYLILGLVSHCKYLILGLVSHCKY